MHPPKTWAKGPHIWAAVCAVANGKRAGGGLISKVHFGLELLLRPRCLLQRALIPPVQVVVATSYS